METTPIHTNDYQHPQAVTTKGAIELGMTRQIRSMYATDRFTLLKNLDEVIADIWEHYCGAHIDNLNEAFKKEARQLIIEKFGNLGVNEIREAFRLASVNVLNVNLTSYGGKVGLQVIGDCLSKYVEHRRPIAAEIRKAQQQQQQLAQQEADFKKKQEFEAYVLEWFETMKGKVALADCKFYFYDTLEAHGKVSTTPEQQAAYYRMAKESMQKELESKKGSVKSLNEAQALKQELNALIQGDAKQRCINRAKELALYEVMR